MQSEFIDIVFATVPYTDTRMPLMAPAVLKSIATLANKTSYTVDLNVQVIDLVEHHEHKHDLLEFFHDGTLSQSIKKDAFDLMLGFAQQLLEKKPKIVALSVFTYNCQVAAKYISYFIKKISPTTHVIIGGAGISTNLVGPPKFANGLLKAGLIDFYITGDGEKSLHDYLTSSNPQTIDGNAWQELDNKDLLQLPMPDYRDYDFDRYSLKALPILGSRGCVRNCSFCDIHVHWTKFSYRTGEHIFQEMVTQSQLYNINIFKFQDSLINGNMKEYNRLMELVSDYNSTVEPSKRFKWNSFFIIRPMNIFKEADWERTARGGAGSLMVGIETLNDAARFHLGKKFTNQDIDFALQMAKKYNIQLIMLFLTGYVTETDEDLDFAIKWWEDHVEYRDIIQVNVGTPLGVLEGTPLQRDFNKLELKWIGPNEQDWINPKTNNTPAKRAQWNLKIKETLIRLNYRILCPYDNQFILERMLQDFQ